MPNTRKKVIKTVYKDEDDSEEAGDFSDSGSDAVLSHQSSSEDDDSENYSDEDDFKTSSSKKQSHGTKTPKKVNVTKTLMNKLRKQKITPDEEAEPEVPFSIKDLTDADKLLPSFLNLSESDSSDDESGPSTSTKKHSSISSAPVQPTDTNSDNENNTEYKDVWSNNAKDNSEEIARKTYLELEKHKNKIEEAKVSIQKYSMPKNNIEEADVNDLLALGEEELPHEKDKNATKRNFKKKKNDSDSEMEDWEEVDDKKPSIPAQGLQLVVNIPDSISRKTKKVDVEMMMKRKMNRAKKECQVFLHKVHALCWIGHGNYVSRVLNDHDVMSAALALIPSKGSYPDGQVNLKYVEQMVIWYKGKVTLKQDKNENKFKPKAPPLKEILMQQISKKVFTAKKYMVFVFVAMLRSLGLQCRIMFNFLTVPLKPPSSELFSLSLDTTKTDNKDLKESNKKSKSTNKCTKTLKENIPQLDGIYDTTYSSDSDDNIMQIDGNDDNLTIKTRRAKNMAVSNINNKKHENIDKEIDKDDVSPPKRKRIEKNKEQNEKLNINNNSNERAQRNRNKVNSESQINNNTNVRTQRKSLSLNRQELLNKNKATVNGVENVSQKPQTKQRKAPARNSNVNSTNPQISITNETGVSSKFFVNTENPIKDGSVGRKRSRTSEPKASADASNQPTKLRTRSVQGKSTNTSKYFESKDITDSKKTVAKKIKKEDIDDDSLRVSHKDLTKKNVKIKKDVTEDLINIIKGRVKEAKTETRKKLVKGKAKKESDDDSDYLPVESPKRRNSGSDEDFKKAKCTPKSKSTVAKKKIDRRVLSTDDEGPSANSLNVWCEIFIEELEEWVAVDVFKAKVHCAKEIYRQATHPVRYVVGWDNNNYLKDLTRRYVPHWNTETRKQRVDPAWWQTALKPWLGPKTPRDREEDERLDRMQLDAPLPTTISEYKNHPLYALKRHLLKFEAIYPPDAAVLGFVRKEPVYSRECVYVCRSRTTWLKQAKVVKPGEQPYKIVKARPKWDRLSNKLITGELLEVFGPWQIEDYEPPVAENGIVPRNPYGNVELFKDCMLPKGTVHIKLPGLNRVAKKMNIDCAPAMVGFDSNCGWSHPVYDGFVVCKEFEEIVTEAWLKDQEEQVRREREKIETRVYGNWKKLIKGLLIKERLKAKYGFEEAGPSQANKKPKGPRLVVKKK